MILQTHKDLPPEINKFGCYFMSILWANLYFSQMTDFTDAQAINSIFKTAHKYGYIAKDAFITYPNGVSKVCLDYFKLKSYAQYQGKHDQRYVADEISEIILGAWKYRYTHFVVMDGLGNRKKNIKYDPLGKSETVKHGELISTRIYKCYG